MKAHDARHERYQKEQLMFKEQDKILDHVMSTIEKFYKEDESVNTEAVQKSEQTVQTVLLETIGPQEQGTQVVVSSCWRSSLARSQRNKPATRPPSSVKVVVTPRLLSRGRARSLPARSTKPSRN